jgi:glycosyltransferase involved in cell wall biosynthesis
MSAVPSPSVAAQPPMRILVVISGLGFGGAERQVVELANNVPSAEAQLQVCSLSTHVPQAAQLRDAARLHILPKRGRFDFTVVPRLARLLRRERIDLVHGFLFDAEIAAALAGRLAGVRAVVGSERNTAYAFSCIQRWAYRLARPCFDAIVANSDAGAAFNCRALGFAADKYRVVRNGVDTVRFRPLDGATTRAALGYGPADLVVGMFASFKEQKNHLLLLHAVPEILRRVPAARFLFVGDSLAGNWQGSNAVAGRVRAMVDELGIAGFCQFLGNRSDMPELYAACDLTALPSLYEGTPNTVLESMACGRPVVVTDVSDNARIAPDGIVGRVVPSGDQQALAAAVVAALSDVTLRTRYGLAARAWAEQEFSLAALSRNILAVYRSLLR